MMRFSWEWKINLIFVWKTRKFLIKTFAINDVDTRVWYENLFLKYLFIWQISNKEIYIPVGLFWNYLKKKIFATILRWKARK